MKRRTLGKLAIALCVLGAVIGVIKLLSWLWASSGLAGLEPRPAPSFSLGTISERTGLRLPDSAVLVDAYVAPGWAGDATYYAKVELARDDVEEFTNQPPMKGTWRRENLMAGELWGIMKQRWNRDLRRVTDCLSCETGTAGDFDGMTITICLDDPELAMVYFCLLDW